MRKTIRKILIKLVYDNIDVSKLFRYYDTTPPPKRKKKFVNTPPLDIVQYSTVPVDVLTDVSAYECLDYFVVIARKYFYPEIRLLFTVIRTGLPTVYSVHVFPA